MADTFEQVKGIIVELLGVDAAKVTTEARFREDLEADSLDLVELIMAFEEKFDQIQRGRAEDHHRRGGGQVSGRAHEEITR